MELHDGQKSVRSLLYRGNVCARVGRRWGKTLLAANIANQYAFSRSNVAYVVINNIMKKYTEDLVSDRVKVISSTDGINPLSSYDLLVLDDPAYFQQSFWLGARYVINNSRRVIAIGTQDYTAPSAKYFAMLPFEPGWTFYSGGSEECPIIPKGLLDEIKAERPEIYKVQYGGH